MGWRDLLVCCVSCAFGGEGSWKFDFCTELCVGQVGYQCLLGNEIISVAGLDAPVAVTVCECDSVGSVMLVSSVARVDFQWHTDPDDM